MPTHISRNILLFFVIFLGSIEGYAGESEREGLTERETKISQLNQQLQELQQSWQKQSLEKDNKINALTLELEKFKVYQQFSPAIERLTESNRGLESQHSTIVNFIALILGLISLFSGASIIYTFRVSKASQEEWQQYMSRLKQEGDTVINELEESRKEQLRYFDQLRRLMRLTVMLGKNDFDSDTFYADLTQMAQDPDMMMANLVEQILFQYKAEFDDDVIELAEDIRQRL